jgi:hypothetical protein
VFKVATSIFTNTTKYGKYARRITMFVGVSFFFFSFNFLMLLKWQSSIRIFSQIWQYWKYESRTILTTVKVLHPTWREPKPTIQVCSWSSEHHSKYQTITFMLNSSDQLTWLSSDFNDYPLISISSQWNGFRV